VAVTVHTTDAETEQNDGDVVTWAAIPNGNTGDGAAEDWITCSFQVLGTFGAGGSVQMEGSNDGTHYVKLSAAALTSAGFFSALGANERPKWIRPNVTAGDGTTALTVIAFFKKLRTGNL